MNIPTDVKDWIRSNIALYNMSQHNSGHTHIDTYTSNDGHSYKFGIMRLDFSHIAKLYVDGSVAWSGGTNGNTFDILPA